MNYYEHHIGDYAAATAHLSLVEDAVYSRMLRRYYLQEGPLPVEWRQVARLVGARTDDELKAVQDVLAEFFTLGDDGWHQKRADEDIAKFHVKAEKARASANARWERPIVKAGCERNANASETHNGRNALQTPDTRHQIEEEPKGSLSPADADDDRAPPCPHTEIVALYHEHLPANPQVKVWDGERAKALRTRWREDPKRQSLDYWQRFFRHVAASPFLTGQVESRDGRTFLADLGWLVKKSNFIKVIEHKYHDRKVQS